MKKIIVMMVAGVVLSGISYSDSLNLPKNKKSNKHASHKAAKKKKSGYFYSFQY